MVDGLVRKRLLERIAPGRYLIHPFRSLGQRRAVSAPVIAAALLADEPYYLGGWWAVTIHRLSQQQFGSLLDVYVTRQHRERRLRSVVLTFHVLSPDALTYGIDIVQIEDVPVRISDAARTLVDALDYPKTFGNLRAAIQLVERTVERVDVRQIVEYAAHGSRPSTCQRLGLLLERRGAPARELAPLARRTGETASVLPFIPDAPSIGPINKRWRVVENDTRNLSRPSTEDEGDSRP
jgi:predicted transcriptional regulator of viral defense system